jgi:hypothetical protein
MRFARYTTLTGGFPNGFLQLDPTRVAIRHSGSSWTGVLSHAAMQERQGGIGSAPFTSHWLVQSGTSSSDTTVRVTFPSAYSVAPFVIVSLQTGPGGDANFGVNLARSDVTGFTSVQSGFGINDAIVWRSEGTAAL